MARALPNAVQVADRWHLLENSGAAFLAAVRHALPDIRKAVGAQKLDAEILTAAERLQYEGFLRRQHTNRMVRQMAGDGVSLKRIVRLTGLSRKLVPDRPRRARGRVPRPPEQSRALAAAP